MSDIAIISLLVTSAAFIAVGLRVMVGALIEDSIERSIGQ